jgi:hypothetical protein
MKRNHLSHLRALKDKAQNYLVALKETRNKDKGKKVSGKSSGCKTPLSHPSPTKP